MSLDASRVSFLALMEAKQSLAAYADSWSVGECSSKVKLAWRGRSEEEQKTHGSRQLPSWRVYYVLVQAIKSGRRNDGSNARPKAHKRNLSILESTTVVASISHYIANKPTLFITSTMLAARRIAPRLVVAQTQRRTMGSGPKPEWTGIDAKVRAIFPEDWQRTFSFIFVGPRFQIPS